jgi:hypothetical protein
MQALAVFKGAYQYNKGRELCGVRGAYKSASVYKWRAWENCRELCADLGGHGLTVCGRNSSFFSVGFEFNDAAGAPCFMYITASRRVPVRIADGGAPAEA